MIIKQKSMYGNFYEVYSNANFYVVHKENGILFTRVSTTTPDLFEESSIEIKEDEANL